MRAGELNRTIVLQATRKTVAPSGAVDSDWFSFAVVRAKITEAMEEDAEADPLAIPRARLVAVIRWRADVTTDCRLIYQGRAHAVTRTVEVGRRRELELHAVAS